MARADQEERSHFGEPSTASWNDEARTARLIEIIDQFGWPTPDTVEVDGAMAAVLIAQHSDADPAFQQRALTLLTAAEPGYPGKDEAVALLTDRVAANTNQPQVYGSQIRCIAGDAVPYPDVAQQSQVDELREQAGLEPLDAYLARFKQHCVDLAFRPQNAGCAPFAGADELIVATNAVILVGELHGTVESPAFVGELVCIALSYGRDITVGLEIPDDEAAAIEAFLVSDGGTEARQALLSEPFWTFEFKDGRQSIAMLDLLDDLREHKVDGAPLDVVLLDAVGVDDRDVAMAERLRDAIEAKPDGLAITLTGNLHNRAVRGVSFDQEYEPMGFLVDEALGDQRVRSLDVTHSGGIAWVCFQDGSCGERSFERNVSEDVATADAVPFVQLLTERNSQGFDGTYFVGELSAAPPAIEVGGGADEEP